MCLEELHHSVIVIVDEGGRLIGLLCCIALRLTSPLADWNSLRHGENIWSVFFCSCDAYA
jgi:hypothetical protein